MPNNAAAKLSNPEPSVDQSQFVNWFFDNAQELFAIASAETRLIRMVNLAWERTTGWKREEIVGQDIRDFIHPDDMGALRSLGLRNAPAGLEVEPFRLKCKDGTWVWLEGYGRLAPNGEIMAMLRDVTAQRGHQTMLDRAEQFRVLLSQTAGVGAWRYDPRTAKITWSSEMRVMLRRAGIDLAEGADFSELCHPDDVEAAAMVIDHVVATGEPGVFDLRFRAPGGRWVLVRAHARGEPLGDGQYLVHGLSQDVTELVEAREAALRAERQSRRLVEEAPFACALFDRELRYVMASPRWISSFKLTGRSFLGRDMSNLSPGVHAAILEDQHKALRGETSRQLEYPLDVNGRIYWLRWEICPWRDADGEVVGVVVYMDDISTVAAARQEALAQGHRLRIALGAANAAVIETDFRDGVVWCSPEALSLTGYDMAAIRVNRAPWPFIHPDDAHLTLARVEQLAAGEAIEPNETRILRPDGQERWVRIYTEVERDENGRPVKSISLLIDIDERKRQELALIAAERAAHAAAEAKSQFLANMSHEIRTPMNGVLGVLHLLQRQPQSAQAQAMLGEALACGRMLQALLDDVVDVSRIEAGRLDLASEAFEPAAVLEGVVGLLRPQAEAKGLAVSVEADGLPPWILGDPVRLRQCLFNLMGNAVKFTPTGGIVVRARNCEGPDGPGLRFEFQDSGVGIDPQVQGQLFQRFQQADASTTRRFGGSGLGLAITRKLAEMMGGTVSVESEPGVGSTFVLEVRAPGTAAPPAELDRADGMLDGLRMLVVEDNATNRMIATKMLESLGATIEVAGDGERGVIAAAQERFDVILMDIQMPGIDGLEATRRIRRLGGLSADTPVLAVTANVLTHQREAYLDAGMNGVVAKPISPAALLTEIARLAEVGLAGPMSAAGG